MKKGIQSFAAGKGQKRGSRLLASTALTAAGLMTFVNPAHAIDADAMPQGATVVYGSVTNSISGNTYTSDQHTSRALVDFTSMNLGSNNTWNIIQQNTTDRFVGRDRNDQFLPSVIDGAVNAKGQVFFLNKNGVIFGKNSRIDVGSIVASTGDLDENSFINSDKVIFSNFGDGSVLNEGQISVADAGLAAFVGKNVANAGIINAKVGKVALAAGDTAATLDLYGDGLVEFAVDGAKGKVLASNSGTINAEGGTVAITANAAKDVVDNVINMDGIINVSSVTVKGGKIILGGGKSGVVKVSGKVTASGEKGGGDVKITGKNVHVTEDAVITSNAGANGNGGNTYIYGDDYTVFSGLLASQGGSVSGDGGQAEISAGKGVGYYGLVDLSANDGKTGSLLIDPEYLTISKAGFSGDPLYFLSLTALGTVNINDLALANTLRLSNVNLWATKKLSVTEDIDLSTWEQKNYTYSFPFCILGCAAPSTFGITNKDLTVAAPTVDINGDVILGTGKFNITDLSAGTSVLGFGILNVPAGGIKVDTVNLDGVFKRRTAYLGTLSDALDSQINSNAETINVKSNNAKIQQAVYLSDDDTDLTTINVAAGLYNESVTVGDNHGNIIIKGAKHGVAGNDSSRDAVTGETIVDPNSPGFLITANDVTLDGLVVTGATEDGIVVDGAENVTIKNSIIHDVIGDGIFAKFADGLKVFSNRIYDITSPEWNKGSGVQVQDSSDVLVGGLTDDDANIIHDTEWDGVRLVGTTDGTVQNNDIDRVRRTGVYAGGTSGSFILDNHITTAGRYGVNYDYGNNATISGNDIDDTGLHGINMRYVAGTNLVSGNHIDTVKNSDPVWGDTGGDGIHLDTVAGLTVDGNFIGLEGGVKNIKGDGIFGTHIDSAVIKKNEIANTDSVEWNKGSGIQVQESTDIIVGGSDEADANTIYDTAWDGVRLVGTTDGTVQNNDIDRVRRTGVYAGGTSGSFILDNHITTAGRYGVNYDYGNNATISGNDIDDTGLHGITMRYVAGTNLVSGNHIDTVKNSDPVWGDTGGDGIHLDTVAGLTVHGNFIGVDDGNINGDGIYGIYVDGAVITANEITGTIIPEWNKGSGIHIWSSDSVRIGGVAEGDENTIYETGWDGVRLFLATNATVQRNDIDDVGRTGIYSGYGLNNYILGNNIDGTGRYGINYDHGAQALIQDNIINDTGLHGIQLINVAPSGSYIGGSLVSGNHIDNVHGVDLVYGGTGGDGIHAENIYGLSIYSNYIGLNGPIAENGIFVDPSPNVQITSNQVNNVGHNGIYSLNNDDAYIAANTVTNSTWNGILSEGGYNVTIGDYDGTEGEDYGNHVDNSGINGIEVDGTTGYVAIRHNTVTNSGTSGANGTDGDGIQVHDVYDEVEVVDPDYYDKVVSLLASYVNSTIEIIGNHVDTAKEDGIDVHNVAGTVLISGNDVTNIGYNDVNDYETLDWNGHDGIFVSNVYSASTPVIWARAAVSPSGSYDVKIIDNDVDTTEDDGIEVISSGRTLIQGNTIFDVGQNATYWEWDGYGADGIHVRNVYNNNYDDEGYEYELMALLDPTVAPFSLDPITDSAVDILDNYVNVSREDPEVFTGNTADDGIQVLYSGNTVIDSNRVANSGFVVGAPEEEESDEVYGRREVEGPIHNKDGYGADGIHVLLNDPYSESKISIEGPWYYGYGDSADITNNFVDNSDDDGIDADYVHYLTVDTNDVDVSGNQGIEIVGGGYGYPPVIVDGEEVPAPVMLLGLFPSSPWSDWTAIVTNNKVNNSGKNGIKIKDYDLIEASYNTVDNSGKSGLLVTGKYNGNVHVEGNTFTDNKIGATFRSGLIDLTGASNTFNNGQVGLKFSPIEFTDYEIVWNGEGFDYIPVQKRSFLELIDDDAPGVQPASDDAPISNFGGTIGAQIFNNQTKYFVQLKNGAFYDPGTPTWLNGTNSTYTSGSTTVTPSSNALSPAEWAFLEPMFRDWDDTGAEGRFWGLAIPQAARFSVDQQNIFDTFDPFAPLGGQVNVVLLGLPRLTAGGAGPTPFNPANIEPAAGGDEETQTASMSPEELNQIASAAGDDNASNSSCWVDASAAATGGATTFSFSSVINQTTLQQETSCGSNVQAQ